jgi:hypothetical protein
MKRIYLLAPAALLALAATPALADKGRAEAAASEATASSAPAPAGASVKTGPKICRTFENSASRLKPEKLCLTRQEWKKFDDAQ